LRLSLASAAGGKEEQTHRSRAGRAAGFGPGSVSIHGTARGRGRSEVVLAGGREAGRFVLFNVGWMRP